MRRTRLGILGLMAMAVVLGCSQPPSATPTPGVASPVDGVVVAVDSAGLGNVRGFNLRTPAGASLTFTLGPLENAASFSPSHLAEHMATSAPVRAWFRLESGARVVYRLEDAPAAMPAATPGAT